MPSAAADDATALARPGFLSRSSSYLTIALLLALGWLVALAQTGPEITEVDSRPSFHLAVPDLARLNLYGRVLDLGRAGRIEVRQYGELLNRGTDMTIALMMPKDGRAPTDDLLAALGTLQRLDVLQDAQSMMLLNGHYELNTRFGPLRALEAHLDADRYRKLCLGFISRFETGAAGLFGWYCEASGTKPSPTALACMIDRLKLDGELASPKADNFLRTQLARAPTCSAIPQP
jgi:hypothetical protein